MVEEKKKKAAAKKAEGAKKEPLKAPAKAKAPASSVKLTSTQAELPKAVFGVKTSMPTVHQLVVRQLANKRLGTKATKGRSDVRGSGAKPWRQKGTGRARVGDKRSPLWRGGARHHPIRPHGYEFEMPRAQRRGALRGILSERAREGAVMVVESLDIPEPKTRHVKALLDQLGSVRVTFLMVEAQRNFVLGARNLPGVAVLTLDTINPVDLISAEKIVVTKAALDRLPGLLAQAQA